jgi:hypothetical protein
MVCCAVMKFHVPNLTRAHLEITLELRARSVRARGGGIAENLRRGITYYLWQSLRQSSTNNAQRSWSRHLPPILM